MYVNVFFSSFALHMPVSMYIHMCVYLNMCIPKQRAADFYPFLCFKYKYAYAYVCKCACF